MDKVIINTPSEIEAEKQAKRAKLKKAALISAGVLAAAGGVYALNKKGAQLKAINTNRATPALAKSAKANDAWLRNDAKVITKQSPTKSEILSAKQMRAERRANMSVEEKEALKKRFNNYKKSTRAKKNMMWGPSAMGGYNQAINTKEYSMIQGIYFDVETRSFSTDEARAKRAEDRKHKALTKSRRGHGRAYLVGGVGGLVGAAGTTEHAQDLYKKGYTEHDIKKSARKRAAKRGAIIGGATSAVFGGLSGGIKGALVKGALGAGLGAAGSAWGANKRVDSMHDRRRSYDE